MSENATSIASPEQAITKDQYEEEKEICSMYIDCAKTYTQLCGGALLVSITFFSDILGIAKITPKGNPMLVVLWALWLIAIVFGVTYQYAVVKYLETIADDKNLIAYKRSWKLFIPKRFRDSPYVLYGIMVFLFYIGVILFSVMAFIAIFK